MKKIFSNRGVTLVEVVVAVVILGIISIPIFNTITHTIRMNLSSDEAIRMNASIQRIIEEVKATGQHARFKYYDKMFNEVAPAEAYYTIELKTEMNTVNKNTDEYDRWDFDLILHVDGRVSLHKNSGVKKYSDTAYGKLYQSTEVFGPRNMNNITLDFIGKKVAVNPYTLKYGPTIADEVAFTPGIGKNLSVADETIVLNIINEGRANEFNLTVFNNTCYKNYPGEFYTIGSELAYYKYIIVNIFNNDSKVVMNEYTSYLDINYKNEDNPHIINGNKVIVEVRNNKGKLIKEVNSVIAKDVKIN